MTDPNVWHNSPQNGIPQQNSPQQAQNFQLDNSQLPQQFNSAASNSSGSMKKLGLGALAVVVVGALAVGGFQVFKSTQSPEPNPSGISDEVAQEVISGGVDDCMLPKEIIDAAGIKDFARNKDNKRECSGFLATADGRNESKVSIAVESGGPGDEASDVEGWDKSTTDDDGAAQSMEDIVSELDNGHSPYGSSGFGCRLYGDDRAFREVTLSGPTCESLYPIAKQLNNLLEQDDYLTQKTDFFELKEMPGYSPVEPAGQYNAAIDGFIEARDSAPEGETEYSIEQLDFESLPYRVKGVNVDESSESSAEVCVDLSFTASKRKEEGGGTYYLPSFVIVSSEGEVQSTYDRDLPLRFREGERIDYQQCASISKPSSSDVMRNVDYVVLAGVPHNNGEDSERKFQTDAKANVVGTFGIGG